MQNPRSDRIESQLRMTKQKRTILKTEHKILMMSYVLISSICYTSIKTLTLKTWSLGNGVVHFLFSLRCQFLARALTFSIDIKNMYSDCLYSTHYVFLHYKNVRFPKHNQRFVQLQIILEFSMP